MEILVYEEMGLKNLFDCHKATVVTPQWSSHPGFFGASLKTRWSILSAEALMPAPEDADLPYMIHRTLLKDLYSTQTQLLQTVLDQIQVPTASSASMSSWKYTLFLLGVLSTNMLYYLRGVLGIQTC